MGFPTHLVCAGGIVENESGAILLVKQRDGRGWCFPGGQVEEGEDLIDAVIREIKEESGINITVNKLIVISSNTAKYEDGIEGLIPTKVLFDFSCAFVDGELCTSEETSDSKWVKKDEVLSYITAPVFRERYQAYLEFDGNVRYLEFNTRPDFILKLKREL